MLKVGDISCLALCFSKADRHPVAIGFAGLPRFHDFCFLALCSQRLQTPSLQCSDLPLLSWACRGLVTYILSTFVPLRNRSLHCGEAAFDLSLLMFGAFSFLQ